MSVPAGFPSAPTGRPTAGIAVNEKEPFLRDDYIPVPAVIPAPSASARLWSLVGSGTDAVYSVLAPALRPLSSTMSKFDAWREKLDLGYPGQVDALGREAKSMCKSRTLYLG